MDSQRSGVQIQVSAKKTGGRSRDRVRGVIRVWDRDRDRVRVGGERVILLEKHHPTPPPTPQKKEKSPSQNLKNQ